MNIRASFHARLEGRRAGRLLVRLAAASAYRVWIGGRFAGQGPARAARGHARVDEWSIRLGRDGPVDVVIEVTDYGVPTFCETKGEAFCQAEVEMDGKVLVWTAPRCGGFLGEHRREVVQRIERYSYQRAFCEGYRLGIGGLAWLRAGYVPSSPVVLRCLPHPRALLERGVAYPDFTQKNPRSRVETGRASFSRRKAARARKHRFLHNVPKVFFPLASSATEGADYASDGFGLSEVEWPMYETLSGLNFAPGNSRRGKEKPLKKGEWLRWDFGRNLTGFPCLELRVLKKSRVVILFDEILVNGEIDFDRLECLNAMWLEIEPGGKAPFQAFEPYTLRYLQVLVWEGEAAVAKVRLRNCASSEKLAAPGRKLAPALARVRAAALASFRQNALDVFMDCPSRERAGWLGDSLFASRAEWHLCGGNPVERAFLENFLLPRRFAGLPGGMVPMCYPAEVLRGEFIPNFAMFLVLQLDEAWHTRRLPRQWRPLIERRVGGLLRYFRRFENEWGLLEKLEGWVFVEWSEAARFTRDVNFPTNMLYAAMLEASARLLQRPALAARAVKLRRSIQLLAWRGGRYADNALRSAAGKLMPTENASEVCQYYAFFFGQTSPQECPELWQRLAQADYGDLVPANVIMGKLLRLDLLIRHGEHRAARRELLAIYAPMARLTGTLWEHLDVRASCNHGITSYLAVLIDSLSAAPPVSRKFHRRGYPA